MDYYNPIDLEDLPSDAFGTSDIGVDQLPDVNDFSSWPAESSPAPLHEQDEGDYYDEEADQDYEDHGDQDFDGSVDEEDDQDEQEEQEELEEEDDVLEYVLAGEDDPEVLDFPAEAIWNPEADFDDYGDFDGYDGIQNDPNHSRPASRGFDGFLPQIRVGGAGRLSEAPSDSLFVDQNENFLPPIATLLSDARRHHARAIELMSEIQAEARRARPSRSPGLSFARGSRGPSREASNYANHRHRHHPYDNMAPQGGRNVERGARGNNNRPRDELVAMEMQSARSAPRRSRTTPPAQIEVIDLTGDPESPQEVRSQPFQARSRPANSSQNAGRNPRRQMSLNQRTPSLARSDSNALQDNANFIDLTLDDAPAPPPLPQQLPRRVTLNHIHQHHHLHHRPSRRQPPAAAAATAASSRAQPIIDLEAQDDLPHPGFFADFVRSIPGLGFVRRRLGGSFHHFDAPAAREAAAHLIIGMDNNPLAGNIPILNYRGNGHGQHGGGGGGAPKPEHVPPPPAREGFTRNTGVEDEVVVCAGCEGELKYDPEEGAGAGSGGNAPSSSASASVSAPQQRPAKKPRTRKDREEHYFWALKECGHVYCKECYDSRSPRSKSAATAGFRRGGDNNKKVLCAVEGCSTEVNNKIHWVGLFL